MKALKISALAALTGCISLSSGAQTIPDRAAAGTRVEGVVFDGDADKPLAGVVVQIGGGLKVTTGVDGKFAFISVPAGSSTFLVQHLIK